MPHSFRIVTRDGHTALDADDLVAYAWDSHTLRLRPGVRDRLRRDHLAGLVHGVPFAVVADGARCYDGVLTTSASSATQSTAVINLVPITEEVGEDELAITLGFP